MGAEQRGGGQTRSRNFKPLLSKWFSLVSIPASAHGEGYQLLSLRTCISPSVAILAPKSAWASGAARTSTWFAQRWLPRLHLRRRGMLASYVKLPHETSGIIMECTRRPGFLEAWRRPPFTSAEVSLASLTTSPAMRHKAASCRWWTRLLSDCRSGSPRCFMISAPGGDQSPQDRANYQLSCASTSTSP